MYEYVVWPASRDQMTGLKTAHIGRLFVVINVAVIKPACSAHAIAISIFIGEEHHGCPWINALDRSPAS